MMSRMKNLMRSEDGQGMTEYIIIVALIAIACIGIITLFGQNIRALFAASAGVLAGDTAATTQKYGSGTGKAGQRQALKDFGNTQLRQ